MFVSVKSADLLGVTAQPAAVEVYLSAGLPGFAIVGLPDAACRDARDRVRAATLSSGFNWPQHRATVNLAPSGVRKVGAGYDLPIALGLLMADGQIPMVDGLSAVGELGLGGDVRRVPGIISIMEVLESPLIANEQLDEASLVGPAIGVATLEDAAMELETM